MLISDLELIEANCIRRPRGIGEAYLAETPYRYPPLPEAERKLLHEAWERRYGDSISTADPIGTAAEKDTIMIRENLNVFTANQYWSRAWIVQEVILGANREIWFGETSVTWSSFSLLREYQHRLCNKAILDMVTHAHLKLLVNDSGHFDEGRATMIDPPTLGFRYSAARCADPRDLCYAWQSFIQPQYRIRPDYSAPINQVFFQSLTSWVCSDPQRKQTHVWQAARFAKTMGIKPLRVFAFSTGPDDTALRTGAEVIEKECRLVIEERSIQHHRVDLEGIDGLDFEQIEDLYNFILRKQMDRFIGEESLYFSAAGSIDSLSMETLATIILGQESHQTAAYLGPSFAVEDADWASVWAVVKTLQEFLIKHPKMYVLTV